MELYQTAKSTVSEYIKNIYSDEELSPETTVRKIRTVQTVRRREVTRELDYYNLDMIIALGYRINSKIATRFRQWATARLREYIVKEFIIEDERLKNLGGGNYWKELLDRIRDIRLSEKVMYRQVLDLYATATDYNPKSAELYQSSRSNVVKHIKNSYNEGELYKESTCRNIRQVRLESYREVNREIPFYNLDMVISLGYRIKSSQGGNNSTRIKTKDLTISIIERQNILNNRLAIEAVAEELSIAGMLFEGEYRFTKSMVAEYYKLEERTVERYIERFSSEL